jgi:uncharacterized protein (TIGR02271 family)
MTGEREETEQRIELLEEKLSVDVRPVEKGRVRVDVKVRTDEQVVEQELERQEVTVRRVPVDRVVEVKPEIRFEGDTMIVPLVEEVLVVEKRLILREELHIQQSTTRRTEQIPVTLRSEEAVITRDGVPVSTTVDDPQASR